MILYMFNWPMFQDEIIKAKDDIITSKDVAIVKKQASLKHEISTNTVHLENIKKLKYEVCDLLCNTRLHMQLEYSIM